MMRGRPRKPDNEKIPVAPGEPICPDDMPADGRELWANVCDNLPADVLSLLDGPTLEGMCRSFALWREIITDTSMDKCKRAIAAQRAWKEFYPVAKSFGLTPADRGRLRGPPKQPAEGETNILRIAGIDAG